MDLNLPVTAVTSIMERDSGALGTWWFRVWGLGFGVSDHSYANAAV